jgi:hypothetical protein
MENAMNSEIQRLKALLANDPTDHAARQRLADLTARDGSDDSEPDKPKLLSFKDGVFVWNGGYETRQVPKEAGFLWHGGRCRPNCGACKARIGRKWWTKREANAARIIQYADPSARKALARHMGTVAASRASAASISVPAPKGLRYLPFQQAGIAYALGRKGTLIADQMGLGKTVQALGVINADDSVRKVLCVVPASLRLNWLREAQRWLTRSFRFFVAEKTTDLPPMEADFVIVNYAKLAGRGSQAFLKALLAREWDIIILDEAHYLKNPKAKRTKAVLGYWDKRSKANVPGLIHKADRRVMLTGTPILNRPIEAQPLLGALAPKEFGHFMYFAKRYANAHHNGWGWDFGGASNLGELQERARGCCMVRRLKSEVLKELPAKIRQVICIPPNGMAGVVERERQEAVDRFQDDPNVKVFLGNLKAAGVGLTLTAASTVVFAELDWVPANMSQAEDRAHRIGQLDSVLVQHLVVDGSLDAKMAFALVEKQEIADRALDLGTRLNIDCPIVPKAPKAKRYPEATPEQRGAAGAAMILLSTRCDGARAQDGAGFNKLDTDTGLSLAQAASKGPLTDGQVWLATKLAQRYRRQLPEDLLSSLGLQEEASPAQEGNDPPPASPQPSAPRRKADSFTLEECPF